MDQFHLDNRKKKILSQRANCVPRFTIPVSRPNHFGNFVTLTMRRGASVHALTEKKIGTVRVAGA